MVKRKNDITDDEDGDAKDLSADDSDKALEKSSKISKSRQKTKPPSKASQIQHDGEGHTSKRPRTSKAGQSAKSSGAEDAVDDHPTVCVNGEGEKYIDLGKKRRATIRKFKGTVFLDIREYYTKDSEELPGKKGISLSLEQWHTLKNSTDAIDAMFSRA